MRSTRLLFKGVSEIVGSTELGVILLTDEDELRQISIVCDKAMVLQIELRLSHKDTTATLLPEVLCRMISRIADMGMKIVISGVDDGQYHTVLCNRLEWVPPTAIRASDAVLLSIVAGVPIYINEELMARQSVPYRKNSRGVALPVNTISDEMLRSALDKAIDEENYELASRLRDEMLRRGKGKPGGD